MAAGQSTAGRPLAAPDPGPCFRRLLLTAGSGCVRDRNFALIPLCVLVLFWALSSNCSSAGYSAPTMRCMGRGITAYLRTQGLCETMILVGGRATFAYPIQREACRRCFRRRAPLRRAPEIRCHTTAGEKVRQQGTSYRWPVSDTAPQVMVRAHRYHDDFRLARRPTARADDNCPPGDRNVAGAARGWSIALYGQRSGSINRF